MITPNISRLIYGGDHHPEQWPGAVGAEDAALMKRAGMNLVTVGEFIWCRLQPDPDTFTFDWLDRVFDLLHAHDLRVNLTTGTTVPPPWLRKTAGVTPTRQCPNDAPLRAHGQRLVRELAGRYGIHPALASWQINIRTGSAPCHCADCAAQFRVWLRHRYETLEALNDHWGTAAWGQHHSQWEEIFPPGPASGHCVAAGELDYRRFLSDAWLAVFLSEKNLLREITPEIPVTLRGPADPAAWKMLNGFEWARHVDFISFHSDPDPLDADPADLAFNFDLQRGLGAGRPWRLLQAASQGGGRPNNPAQRPGQMRLWSCQALAHGADAITFTHWRAPGAGAGKFHSAMLPHGGTETRTFREVEALGAELEKLSAICGATTRAEVALIFDWENWWAVESDAQPARINYVELVRSYYRALFEPDVPIDLVSPEADLAKYKLVVAPALCLVRPGVAPRLETFVDNGGTLIMTFFSGLVDASDRVLPGGHPGPFRKLLGLHVGEFDAFGSQLRHFKTPLRGARCTLWADLIELEGAEAVATFTEDFHAHQPAITRNAVGRGLAYYIGTHPEPAFLRAFLAELCVNCGVRPPMRAPAGVEVTTRSNEHGEFLFLLNHQTTMQFVDLGPRLRRDLLTGEMVQGQCQLGPREVRVLQLAEEDDGA